MLNDRAGLSIRKPSVQVPFEEPSAVPPSSGACADSISAVTVKGAKAGKPMVASPTVLSAR